MTFSTVQSERDLLIQFVNGDLSTVFISNMTANKTSENIQVFMPLSTAYVVFIAKLCMILIKE